MTTTTPAFKFQKIFNDSYAILVDGTRIGEVKKYVQHYNLARPFTERGWTARDKDGHIIGEAQRWGGAVFGTRQAAAEAVWAAREETNA